MKKKEILRFYLKLYENENIDMVIKDLSRYVRLSHERTYEYTVCAAEILGFLMRKRPECIDKIDKSDAIVVNCERLKIKYAKDVEERVRQVGNTIRSQIFLTVSAGVNEDDFKDKAIQTCLDHENLCGWFYDSYFNLTVWYTTDFETDDDDALIVTDYACRNVMKSIVEGV